MGNVFTIADLSFACMAAPVLLPSPVEGYGAVLPLSQQVHQRFSVLVNEWRDSVAGKFALRLFRENRGHPVIQCKPLIASKL